MLLFPNPSCDVIFIYSGNAKHYEIGETPYEIQITDTILEHYKIPAINLVKEIDEQILTGGIKIGDETNKYFLSNSEQKIFSQSLKTFLQNEWDVTAFSEKLLLKELPPLIDEFSFFNGKQIEPNPRKPIKGWQLQENKNERALEGTYPGKIIKFHFKGNAVGIATLASLDAGIIEYSVDNQPWKKQDLFTENSELKKEIKYFILESELTNRRHTLQLRLTTEKNPESSGYVCRIRYFFFNE